jgi:endonuclease/exonuclease/phosphatase (EEP) superfamily protein YafD
MLGLAGWVLVGIGALLFASRFPRTRWQPHVVVATFAGYAPLPLAAGALLLVADGGPWLPTAAVLLAVGVVQAVPRLRRGRRGDHLLTVLTANLWCGRGDADVIVSLARRHAVDVVALQELTEDAVRRLEAAGLDTLLPHRVVAPAPDWEGAGLWSRLPMRDQEMSRRGTLYRVSAVVAVDEEPAVDDPHVTSVHIHAPWPGPSGPWVDQLDELRMTLVGRTGPMIVASDFNATLGHAEFRRLLRAGRDAAVAARAWRVRTWPQHLPLPAAIAIDHVVLSGLGAAQVSTHVVPGSDHRAVIARVVRSRAPHAT